jgi:adenine-specific DNA-methyltransferase
MATGVSSKAQQNDNSFIERSLRCDPWPLPKCESLVRLEYDNKVSKEEILMPFDSHYVSVSSSVATEGIDSIPLNSLVFSDNFQALKKLSYDFNNRVRLIYLDPPYGTGMDFQSRNLDHAYKDTLGTASWVEMMRRRLIVMRELLTNDGSIYIHIGHQMLFHLKVIMDEVFGEDNFRNIITRRKCSSKNSTKKQYPNVHDYVLFYSKSNKWLFNQPGVPATEEWISKEYTKEDEKGRYKLVPIHAPGLRNGDTGKEWKGMKPPKGKHWQYKPSTLDELDVNGEIHWSKTGNPRRKVYLTADKKIPINDLWSDYRDAHHQSKMITGYPTEKNLDMLKMIVQASSNEGDIVLDPFCGSGTTLHAARDLNRKWIGIDQSITAIDATVNRMKHGLRKMGDYVNATEVDEQSSVSTQSEFNLVVDKNLYDDNQKLINELIRR